MYRVFCCWNAGSITRDRETPTPKKIEWSSEEAEGYEPVTITAYKPQKSWGTIEYLESLPPKKHPCIMQIPWLDLFYLGVPPLILIYKFRLSLRCCCHKEIRIAILAGKGTGKSSKSGSKLHPSGILWAKGPANGSGGIFLQVTAGGVPKCFVSLTNGSFQIELHFEE